MRPRLCGYGTSTSSSAIAIAKSEPPRVKLPDGPVVQIEPDWFDKLSGFTLLFGSLVLALRMTFAAVARLVSES
jgi:hypothetical protein